MNAEKEIEAFRKAEMEKVKKALNPTTQLGNNIQSTVFAFSYATDRTDGFCIVSRRPDPGAYPLCVFASAAAGGSAS
jgi:hypothetical protein